MTLMRRWLSFSWSISPRAWLAPLALLAAIAPVGCGGDRVQIANPIPVGRGEYDRVFDATLDVLRDNRFDIARQDRRYGVVTTEPRTAAMALEVWHPDRTTPRQITENTLNHQRYRITARIRPRDVEPTDTTVAPDADRAEPPRNDAFATADYELALEARLERRQTPPRILNTAAVAGTEVRRKAGVVRPLRTETGEIEPHWRPAGRDREYERRLIATILHRAAAEDRPLPQTPAEPPTDDGEPDGPYRPYQPGDEPETDAPDTPPTPEPEPTPDTDDQPSGRYQPYPG